MDERQLPLLYSPFISPFSFGPALMWAPHSGGRAGVFGRIMELVLRMGSAGDFGAESPGEKGSGGKAFCSTKRFLWHKNTPCPAFRPYAKRAAQLLNFQFGGKAMQTLQSACNKGCLNFFPRFPGISFSMNIPTNDLLFCR